MIKCKALIWGKDMSSTNYQFELNNQVKLNDIIRIDFKFYKVDRFYVHSNCTYLGLEPITINRIQALLFYLCCFNSTFITH